MSAKFVKDGYHLILKFWFDTYGTANLFCGLYKSAHTPAITDDLSTYTAIQCDFSGYTSGGISPSSWTDTSYTGSNEAQYTGGAVNWSTSIAGTTNDVYGWYFYDNLTGKLIAAESFPSGPYAMGNLGDSLTLTPHVTSASE